jgi:putative oxidoreductase
VGKPFHTIEAGRTLQRLFSTFPNSWPGVGLVLIRVCLSLALFYFGTTGVSGRPSEPITLAQKSIAVAGSFFLLAGLWTPVMGVLIALNEVSIALSFSSIQREDMWIHGFLAAIAASVAMLGPGAWSIDARLFGRKRFDIDRTRGKRSSP